MTEAAKPRQQLPAPSVLVSPPEDEEDLDEDEEELPEQPLLSTKKVEKYDLHKNLKNKELEEILNKYGYELPSFYNDNDDTNISMPDVVKW